MLRTFSTRTRSTRYSRSPCPFALAGEYLSKHVSYLNLYISTVNSQSGYARLTAYGSVESSNGPREDVNALSWLHIVLTVLLHVPVSATIFIARAS